MLWFLLIWFLGSCLVGTVASSKGRFGSAWFLLSIILSPLLTLIAVAAMPRIDRTPVEETKTCPRCAEKVKLAAVVCRHCGHEFAGAAGRIEPSFSDHYTNENYNNVPYRLYPDGQVAMVIEGREKKWLNFEAFRLEVDRRQKRLPSPDRGRREPRL